MSCARVRKLKKELKSLQLIIELFEFESKTTKEREQCQLLEKLVVAEQQLQISNQALVTLQSEVSTTNVEMKRLQDLLSTYHAQRIQLENSTLHIKREHHRVVGELHSTVRVISALEGNVTAGKMLEEKSNTRCTQLQLQVDGLKEELGSLRAAQQVATVTRVAPAMILEETGRKDEDMGTAVPVECSPPDEMSLDELVAAITEDESMVESCKLIEPSIESVPMEETPPYSNQMIPKQRSFFEIAAGQPLSAQELIEERALQTRFATTSDEKFAPDRFVQV